ncbi:purine-binding chemotaxis protein CheW [Palleronia aestuarii]|uniref:Purine-binding chemotaxis protein CheW n=1 Tax=Palleronia aestuarii TaxID=568105 RepID=A0A2W7NJ95_9RHOB|nr:chemotaxis protein CheW [Palleronia aestuarii]PZX11362.1 purine-binding chemotaxis protein CheW [Palleronia aestuarii]
MLDMDMEVTGSLDEDETFSTYLTLDLGGQRLGLDVRHVREVLDSQSITTLPNAPGDVLGVVDVRGSSVPILDIRARLGMPHEALGPEARIVVLELGQAGATYPLGIQADRVHNVEHIGSETIEPVPCRGLGGWDAKALRGLCRHGPDLVVLIDIDHLLGEAAAELDLSDGFGFF